MVMDAPSGMSVKKSKSKHREDANFASEQVGRKLHAIRKERRLSIRSLAEQSGLSVNTLSLIENGKTSPSVNTLQQLAQSLNVPITAFFESERPKRKVQFQKAGERRQYVLSQGHVESLGLPGTGSETFIARLEAGTSSGEVLIVYAGREFIYCLEGSVTYTIEDESYSLTSGDSLIVEAHTPHSWINTAESASRVLLVPCSGVA